MSDIKQNILKAVEENVNYDEAELGCNWSKQELLSQLSSKLDEIDKEVEYNLSTWRKIGIERGYWAYFKMDIEKESREDLGLATTPPSKLSEKK